MPEQSAWQVAFLSAAFWAALRAFRPRSRRDGILFLAGLVLAAAAAHLAWCGVRWDLVRVRPSVLLDPSAGFTLLATPVGMLGAGLFAAPSARRDFLGRSLAALTIGLGVAKLGCAAVGCCGANAVPDGGGFAGRAVQLAEAAGFLGLSWALQQVPSQTRAALFFVAMGGMRLAAEMARAPHATAAEASLAFWAPVSMLVLGVAISLPRRPRDSLVSA